MRLLDAAAELIAETGYERTTLSRIGERAGYSQGLVTGRFGSKDGLLWSLIQRLLVDFQQHTLLPAIADLAGRDALHHVVHQVMTGWRKHETHMRALYVLIFEALLPNELLSRRMTELHREMRAEVAAAVRRGVGAGTVADSVDPDSVARLFVGALRGAAYQHMMDPDQVPVAAAFRDLDLMVDALLPAP